MLFDKLVAHRIDADGREVFDVVGAWNSVKNVSAAIDMPGAVTFDGFVHTDIDAREAGGPVDLLVIGAKRGNLLTGNSDDRIEVRTLYNDSHANQQFRIATGAGDDAVLVRPFDPLDVFHGDPTFQAMTNGSLGSFTGGGWGAGEGGHNRYVFADLGDGEDLFEARRMPSNVAGGAGNDTIIGNVETPIWTDYNSARRDHLNGGSGDDQIAGSGWLQGGGGDDRLIGYGTSNFSDQTRDAGTSSLEGGDGNDTFMGIYDGAQGGAGYDVAIVPGTREQYRITDRVEPPYDMIIVTIVDLQKEANSTSPTVHTMIISDCEVIRFASGGADLVFG